MRVTPRRQLDVVEEVGALLHGRRAVDEADELLVGLVAHLQRRHRVDRDHAARPEIDALGLVAEQHRQRAGDDDEHLLLRVVAWRRPVVCGG